MFCSEPFQPAGWIFCSMKLRQLCEPNSRGGRREGGTWGSFQVEDLPFFAKLFAALPCPPFSSHTSYIRPSLSLSDSNTQADKTKSIICFKWFDEVLSPYPIEASASSVVEESWIWANCFLLWLEWIGLGPNLCLVQWRWGLFQHASTSYKIALILEW